jgi:hypothetical protein
MSQTRLMNAVSRKPLQIALSIFLLVAACAAQSVPKEIWGKWTIQRELPTRTISCWGEADAKRLIGTQIEYSDKIFRWKGVATDDPKAEVRIVTADQFRDENSSPSSSGSQVSFRQLGIVTNQATEISIHHKPAKISKATVEIPGDNVLVKDPNTIIISVCSIYFEANRDQQ